jgi:hypothetical protein
MVQAPLQGFSGRFRVLRIFPLMIVPVILYMLFAFGGGVTGHEDIARLLGRGIDIRMFSGDLWHFSLGDLLVLVTLMMLFVEIVKATRTTAREIVNHALSMLSFVLAIICFITLKGFSTSIFFFITVMTLFDVVAGYTISIVAAEHDLGLGRAGTD